MRIYNLLYLQPLSRSLYTITMPLQPNRARILGYDGPKVFTTSHALKRADFEGTHLGPGGSLINTNLWTLGPPSKIDNGMEVCPDSLHLLILSVVSEVIHLHPLLCPDLEH
jgi:hypothetical protein